MVDTREPAWVLGLRFGGAPTIPAALDAGDVMVTCDDGAVLAIERKTASDLLNTLADDRLFPQLARLRQTSQWAYLVITGQLIADVSGKAIADGRPTGWNYASVAGALLTAQEMGVMVMQVASDNDFEQAIIRLANRSRGPMTLTPARDASILSEGWSVVAALPGVGIERVKCIRETCDTPYSAISWLTDAGKWAPRMKGIGDGVRRGIRQALEIPDGFYLALDVLPEMLKDEDLPF